MAGIFCELYLFLYLVFFKGLCCYYVVNFLGGLVVLGCRIELGCV